MKEYKTILISKEAWSKLKQIALDNRRSLLSTVDVLIEMWERYK